jgi:tripeptidyl-peptidase-1
VVNEWLSANDLNATVLSPFGDWMGFETTVSHAKELFDAEFSTFVQDKSGKSVIRTLAYSIPASLMDYIDVVHPTITWVICPVLRTPFQGVLTSSAASHPRKTSGRRYSGHLRKSCPPEI